jgi:hypothetical protein
MILVGDALRVIGAQGAAALFGKNAVTRFPGLHLGGGWTDNDRAGYQGRAQWGVVMLSGAGDFTTSSTNILLYIDGITGKHIELFNNTTWACVVSLSMQRNAIVTASDYAVFTLRISKSGGIARVGSIDLVNSEGIFGTPSIVIDASTDTDEHRFNVRMNGSNPITDIYITASIQYTQVATDEYVS